MELEYSPRHSHGGTAHLLPPTHARPTAIDGFSIRDIRRSLSRSPSKPARYQLFTAHSTATQHVTPTSPSASREPAIDANPEVVPKGKFSVKRAGPVRTASRKTSPNSPLRAALGDNVNSANATPRLSRRSTQENEQENMDCSGNSPPLAQEPRFDEPIKLDFRKADRLLQPARQEHASPMKSSPLKRSDGVMNLEAASLGSPRNKRRSLHGPSDFNVFDHGLDGTQSDTATSPDEKEGQASFASTWPNQAANSPLRRQMSLRKSTLQQRNGPVRSRFFNDVARDPAASPALTRARSRISLDSALPLRSFDVESPFSRGAANEPPVLFLPPAQKQSHSAPKPHPLSHALTPSSSNSSIVTGDNVQGSQASNASAFAKPETWISQASFTQSLPIGAARPDTDANQQPSQDSLATPAGYKMAKPLPQAFMSTGLISKRNRNIDMPPAALCSSLNMPDTPSKKAHVHLSSSPAPSALGKVSHPLHEFGSPSTPFGGRSQVSTSSFGKGVNVFGSNIGAPQLDKRNSFFIAEGEDTSGNSPTCQFDSQSSNDDFPPTPTKSASTSTRPQSRGKNSLRSSLFGRRTSLAPDTFAPAADDRSPPDQNNGEYTSPLLQTPYARMGKERQLEEDDSPMPFITLTACDPPSTTFGRSRSLPSDQFPVSPSPLARRSLKSAPLLDFCGTVYTKPPVFTASTTSGTAEKAQGLSPHTPQESLTPPDPSSLSISVHRRPTTAFGLGSSTSFPPATPTGPRVDSSFGVSNGPGHASSSYFANDVDTSLTSRFGQVSAMGMGEFSQVYRVETAFAGSALTSVVQSGHIGSVWAVKKSRKPYAGNKDRQRKMREVQILKELRGHEHLIELVDHWEAKNHLYIQTEFCENGNLKDFLLQTGFKGRLDDFRIWKILLELSQGVKSIHDASFIHLDLKPANVFIDWEGVLKIGDFGMASTWPAPPGLEGEGDREYIGPEVLSGRFDKPADIFALGMIMLEIAGNIVLPDNGTSWQRLRAGDLSDLPSLTWSSDSSLVRDDSGDPIELMQHDASNESICHSNAADYDLGNDHDEDDDLSFLKPTIPNHKLDRTRDLIEPPNFMIDSADPESLDRVVLRMIHPNPDRRPVIDRLLAAGGVQWVEARRRAGATVYEGNWGPDEDVLLGASGIGNELEGDVEMMDV